MRREHSDADIYMVKLDKNLLVVNCVMVGGTGDDIPNCVRETVDGDFIIAGRTNSKDLPWATNKGDFDIFAIKTDKNWSILNYLNPEKK